jgi:hypothetical protein
MVSSIRWYQSARHALVLPTRQAPAQHASRDAADVLEAVHDVARDEDDAAGTRLGGLIADGYLIVALLRGNACSASCVPRLTNRASLTPLSRMGPPPRSFAADAHDCIMARSLSTYRIQGCGAMIRARWRVPL